MAILKLNKHIRCTSIQGNFQNNENIIFIYKVFIYVGIMLLSELNKLYMLKVSIKLYVNYFSKIILLYTYVQSYY